MDGYLNKFIRFKSGLPDGRDIFKIFLLNILLYINYCLYKKFIQNICQTVV